MYTGLTAKLSYVTSEVKEENTVSAERVIGYISNWSVEETRDTIEVTRLGQMEKEIKPSLYSWTASAEGAADFSEGGQKELRSAMFEDKEITVKFYLDGETCLTGKAYVTSFSTDISAEDKGNVSISLTGTGKLEFGGTAR